MMRTTELLHAAFRVLAPTLPQGLGSLALAFITLIVMQRDVMLSSLGISEAAIDATKHQLTDRLGVILQSQVTSQAALVAFWATVGLVIYLLCWGTYNALISARNEVTIETDYINRSHWDRPWGILAIKLLAAALFVGYLTIFRHLLSVWLAMALPVFNVVDTASAAMALFAVFGLATQLYGLLAMAQLTFTPWYTKTPFTEDLV